MRSPDTRLLTAAELPGLLEGASLKVAQPGKERELREHLSLLLKRKWLVLTIVVLATTTFSLYYLSLPSLYEASATLQLDSKEYVYMEDSKGTVLRAYNNFEYQNTQVQLLTNPQLVRQVILKLDLVHNPAFVKSLENVDFFSRLRKRLVPGKGAGQPLIAQRGDSGTVKTNVNELSPAETSQLEPYVGGILAGLRVQPQPKTSLVTVSMTNTDPQLATEIVDTLTKIFITNNDSYETRSSLEAAETLARQIATLQTKIKQTEDDRLNYLKSHNLPLEKGDGRNLTADRLGKLSSQLLDAENDRKNLEASYEAATKASDLSTVPSVRESEEIQTLRKTIHELEQKRAALISIYTTEWPEVKKVDAEIRQLHDDIVKSSGQTVSSLKSKLDAAVAREAKLREAYFNEQGAANTQTQNEVQVANLNQQLETNRQVYNLLFQRQTEMQINSLDKSNHVGIVTPPVIPTMPIGPPRLSRIALAFLVSLMAGVGIALLINQFDNALNSVERITHCTYLPTLALIPSGNGNRRSSLREKVFLRFGKKKPESALRLTNDLRSPAAEAYRHLRSSLLFMAPNGSPRTILVTSGSPFEGKTTTAINTAITFAQSGARVLLIDCDLRRPQVHSHFNLPNFEGLINYLSGEIDLEALILTHQAYPNLKLITAGPTTSNPADLLGSPEMRVLIEGLAENFDHIIIDSSPASSFADASIISTLVDGVVLVVHSQRSSGRVVRRVKERLQAMGADIYGVVLNHVDLATDEYYSGYYTTYE